MRRFEYIVALSWAIGSLGLPQHDLTDSFMNQLSQRALPVGTCNSDTPCENGACCGSNSLCGYSPTECGTGCTSNCNAKAECGQYGTPGQQNCPLNVCCSHFGSAPFQDLNLLWLTAWPAASAEVLLTSVAPAVKRVLADAVLLLDHLAAALKLANAQLGQYEGR